MKERILSWWYAPLPARRLALLRIFVGAFAVIYLAVRAPSMTSVAEFAAGRFEPVGVAALLTQPLPAGLLLGGVVLALLLGVAFTAGFRFAITAPAFALLLLGLTTYRSSWGMIFHTENLLTLHVMLLAASPASDALSFDARGRAPHDGADGRFGWAVRAMSLVTVVAYVVAGIAKLKLSGGTWLGGELLRTQIAYDNLRKVELGTRVFPLGPWLVRHAFVFPPLALLTMLVELGAPLALVQRRLTLVWLVAAWSFHLGVLTTMSIAFVYQLSGVAYLSFLPVETIWGRVLTGLQKSRVSPSGIATSAPGLSRSSKPAAHS